MKRSSTNFKIPVYRLITSKTQAKLLLILFFLPYVYFQAGLSLHGSTRIGDKKPANNSKSDKTNSPNSQRCLYGGIEIGSSGVKAVAIRITSTEEGYDAKEIYAPKIINTNIMLGVEKTNRMSPEPIKDTAQAVDFFYKQMKENGVTAEQIYIVGSSGLHAENLTDLSAKVKETSGKEMTFLDVSNEVIYTISGAVPKYIKVYSTKGQKRVIRKIDNRGRSALIDIGSGNTKGGYQERISPTGAADFRVTTFGIPFGTKSLADRIGKNMPAAIDNSGFAVEASNVSKELIGQPLKTESERKPGLLNRQRIYLSGGIVWAMATLMHPEIRKPYTPIDAKDIDRFYDMALNNPDKLFAPNLSSLDSGTREAVENDINAIKSTFSPKQLIAGAEILKNLSKELRFDAPNKILRFVRKGYIAWILRYVNLQSITSDEGECQ